jgi:hypothetical protein
MGLLELLLVVIAAAGGALGLALWVLHTRRGPAPGPAPRAPLPLLALLVALLGVLAAPVLGFGSVFGGLGWAWMLPPLPEELGLVVSSHPADPVGATALAGALLSAWLASPGLLATGWLLGSRARRWQGAWALGLLGWLGFGLGLALARWLVLPAALESMLAVMPGLRLGLPELVRQVVPSLLALGVAGATLPVIWRLAASSGRALLRCLVATALMPAFALTLGALLTPPDVLSQVVLATLLGLSWLAGLAGGAVTSMVAARGRDGSS